MIFFIGPDAGDSVVNRAYLKGDLVEPPDDEPRACPTCGSTETAEISDERQSITICAGCGGDE